jgi:hypothetical protein
MLSLVLECGMSTRVQIPWPRLVAEFLVIVVGVLVALGVDQWAQGRSDRSLEAEYLERLLEDVRYDLDELVFIRDRSATSAEHSQLVLDRAWVRSAPADSLVGAAYSASITRVPDLSRSTFEELVSSGRIDLLRSRQVREALADYERIINEATGLYESVRPGFLWAWEWLPPDEVAEYEVTCRGPDQAETHSLLGICPFDWALDVESLRNEVLQDDTRRRLRQIANRNTVAVRVTGAFIERARELESVLLEAQPDR